MAIIRRCAAMPLLMRVYAMHTRQLPRHYYARYDAADYARHYAMRDATPCLFAFSMPQRLFSARHAYFSPPAAAARYAIICLRFRDAA